MKAAARIEADWARRPETTAVMRALLAAGKQAFFVGGCVRNTLLGVPVKDIDIATDARPEEAARIIEAAGMKAVPTGIEHGTITIVSGGIAHEVTTFRKDVQTDGRRAVVAYSGKLEEDARRRDFTMNALYADAEGNVIDPLGGLEDLRAGRVRFIGAPSDRIREDYLRILRFFRFHAWYGDADCGLDPAGLAACAENAAQIERLSKERTTSELLKLLEAPDPAASVMAMEKAGVLAHALPGADPSAMARLVTLEREHGLPPDPLRRLAALDADSWRESLRLSRKQARRLERISEAARGDADPAELGYLLGLDHGRDAMILRAALAGESLSPEDINRLEQGAKAKFPIRPEDLMPCYQGKALGEALSRLEGAWIASGFSLTRDDLLERAGCG